MCMIPLDGEVHTNYGRKVYGRVKIEFNKVKEYTITTRAN